MTIRVLEIHHHAIRIDADQPKLDAVRSFYEGVLGLDADSGRPTIPGVPGFWINTGASGQIHLIAGAQPSPLAKGPGQDPTIPHVALACRRYSGDQGRPRPAQRPVLVDDRHQRARG